MILNLLNRFLRTRRIWYAMDKAFQLFCTWEKYSLEKIFSYYLWQMTMLIFIRRMRTYRWKITSKEQKCLLIISINWVKFENEFSQIKYYTQLEICLITEDTLFHFCFALYKLHFKYLQKFSKMLYILNTFYVSESFFFVAVSFRHEL